MNTEPLDGIILTPEAPDGLVSLTTAKPLDLFTEPKIVPALLAAVRGEAFKDFTPDLTTDKGRKAIASRAYKVVRTKTFLDTLGKEEVARLKELPRKVDEGRRLLREGLDALAEEIRKPLTEWEARVDGIKARIAEIQNIPARLMNATADVIECALGDLEAVAPATFEEFEGEVRGILAATIPTVQEQLERRRKFDADQAELERLRKEEEERKRQEREEALRREGEERARKAAEAAAAAAQAATPAPAPSAAPAPAPAPAAPLPNPAPTGRPLTPAEENIEHRRARNREALADMTEVLFTAGIFTKDDEGRQAAETTAKAVLTGIYQGKVRHISITY